MLNAGSGSRFWSRDLVQKLGFRVRDLGVAAQIESVSDILHTVWSFRFQARVVRSIMAPKGPSRGFASFFLSFFFSFFLSLSLYLYLSDLGVTLIQSGTVNKSKTL